MKNNYLNIVIIVAVATFIISGCSNKNSVPDAKVLADTDRYYSALSAEKGMNAAFIAMFDSAGVMLQAHHDPIAGIAAIRDLLLSESDSSFKLLWEPMYSKIAASGELGYTYGTYKIIDKATGSVSSDGTYTTFWQKQDDGSWKAVLDTGNPGLGKK